MSYRSEVRAASARFWRTWTTHEPADCVECRELSDALVHVKRDVCARLPMSSCVGFAEQVGVDGDALYRQVQS